MALGRSPTPPEIRSPERDRAEDAEVAEAEEEFGDAFDIPHKNASLDHLRRWRQDALVLNASRRFRYTLDLKKEEEKEMIRRKIRAHAQVIRAAFLSKEAGEKDLRDWLDSGRGGWNEGSGNSRREGLMPYKQFMQELEDDVSPVEAQCRYEEYVTTQKKTYFDLHKNEDWLRNKYHPTCVESVVERRNELARTTANEFFQELQSGSFDTGPGLTSSAANKSGNNSGLNLEDVDANGKKGKLGKGPDDLYYAAPKAHPVSSEARRIRIDIEHAQALICKLDSEKGIENNVLLSSDHDQADRDKSHGSMGPIVIIRGSSTVMGLEGVELLDTLVTYLWRIHGVDYYGMSETNEPKGLRHVKADSRTYNGASSNAAEWEKKLDSFWQDRIEGQDPLEILKAKEKIDAAANEVLDPHVRKIRDEKYGWKYGCGAKGCTKLFEASEFVQKHLKLKHADLVVELTSKVREDIYFENYMNDPKAPGGTPIMQQAAPREKGRHRPPMESRLRDERGNRRFDRNVDSPTHDGSSENPDDPMYDSYGDPVMHGAFPPDIPAPPVLMPVPGAAPLGPFVPAPREVAMRMLRDQGGPPPFEPTAGPRPRKAGRGGGPSMGGPSPVLAPPLPPPFLHDPRKIRRMNPYPPGGFLSYLQNSSNFPLPREIPHQSPMPPVPAQPFIDVGSGDNDDASRTGKRLTWTQEEDLRLFSAWLNNSNDPINGNCKKNDQYWGEVTAMYNSTTPANRRREVKQAKDRWHRVNKKVGWFYASWLKANRIYASGQSDDQLMDEALKIYEEDYKEGQFMFMYCWKAVQDQPKWHAYIEKLDNLNKRKFSEFREAWEDLTSVEDTKDIPRPQGTKAAKAERKSKGKGKAMAATEVIDDMEEKLDKFLIALSEASKGRSDMVEVQQRMSTEKLQTAKEKKEVKMLDLYKGLFMHDTRGMPDDIKVEHMKALRSMREKLFGPSD